MVSTRALRRTIAGLLASAVIATGLGACSVVGGGGGNGYKVTAWFPSAISLYPESQVRVLGLPAGRVKSIKVIGTRVRVTMSIPRDIPVPADASATIIPLSFIGERYVQLFPAWKAGEPRLKPNSVIPFERTSVPVEPDEALAALKHLLDAIDPKATGELVTNLAEDLDGTGNALNQALSGLGSITETLGNKDAEIGRIIDHFDQLTATLASRDQTLGRVLDAFARTTDALANERTSIQGLLSALSSLSTNTFDLVNEHHVRLDHDLTVLSRTLRMVNQNIGQVDKILQAAPTLVAGTNYDGKSGLAAAYNSELHAIDLRVVVTPDLAQAFQVLGLPVTAACVPVQVACQVPGTTTIIPPDQVGSLSSLVPTQPAAAPKATSGPTPAAKKATADGGTPTQKKHGGISGMLRSISSVFG
ncbi:MAG: phospholipid/cholesterol/gamma-HCH transport system substrate-binding protein [Actinomycetota bacterium]|jgi:virulence factor Mce-like protein